MVGNILASSLNFRKVFLNLSSLDSSENLALGLEDQEISLLLDIKNIVLQKEVLAGLLAHVLNKGKSCIEVVVLVNSFQEAREIGEKARLQLLEHEGMKMVKGGNVVAWKFNRKYLGVG